MEMVNELLVALQKMPSWVWVVLGVILAAILLRPLFARMQGESQLPRAEQRRGDAPAPRELQRTIARLEGENAALSSFFMHLPEFTKEINSRMERRALPPLLLKIADRIFSPSQVLIFMVNQRSNSLVLVQSKGVADGLPPGFAVQFGEGRIGLVAKLKMAMDVDDYIREMRLTGVNLDVTAHFRFKTELCAPMVHNDEVLGVISVGGITRHYKHEKTMLSLIADLGSIALHNNALFSQVQQNANCDGLTKLFNKRFFMQRLAEEMQSARETHSPASIFIFDLDHFKKYNDTQGHQAGDEVLKITGQILRDTVRPDDIPARYGGEEFIVFLGQTTKEEAMAVAERLRERVATHPYANRENQPLKIVSLSGGVATFPDDGHRGDDLIRAADEALYRAKNEGRNRVCRSEPKYFSETPDDIVYGANRG